jgi:Spo0E like sporulation regulatory protein
MDQIANIKGEIERLRSRLVDFGMQCGDLLQEEVVHLSQKLDELIISYYRLTMTKNWDAKIAWKTSIPKIWDTNILMRTCSSETQNGPEIHFLFLDEGLFVRKGEMEI